MKRTSANNKPLLRLAFATLLAGCAHYDNRPLDPETGLVVFEARSLDDRGLAKFVKSVPEASCPAGWNAAGLTLAAFYFRPELAAERDRWTLALAGSDAATEYPNPTLGATPAFNTRTPSNDGISAWVVGAPLDFPIDWPTQRKARATQARLLADAAWLHFLATAWQTRIEIRSEMLSLYHTRQATALWRYQETLQSELLNRIDQKRALGATNRLALEDANQALGAIRIQLLQAEKLEAMAIARLASTIGVPAKALKNVRFDLGEFEHLPPEPPTAAVRRQALMNRADILALLAEYTASQARLQLEIAKQYPDLSIGPGYEFDQGDHKWGLGIPLTLPLFNQNQAAIGTARRQREETAARFNALQANVLGRLDEAMADYAHSYRQFSAAAARDHQRAETLGLLEKQAKAGAVSADQVVAGKIVANEGKFLLLNAQVEAQAALGRLEGELQSPADLPGWKAAATGQEDSHETP